MPTDNWGTQLRDVLTDFDASLTLNDLNATFEAFALEDGKEYTRPYAGILQHLNRQIEANRIETWKKLFDNVGLLSVQNGQVRITAFGHLVRAKWASARKAVDGCNYEIAAAATRLLRLYQLRNPTTLNRDYPTDCDVFPIWSIWKAMEALGGKLHTEELGRVLLKVMRQDQLPAAIDKLQKARGTAEYNPSDSAQADRVLGARAYEGDESQAVRRMTPWFSLAGFGNLLITQAEEAGYRHLAPAYRSLVQDALDEQPSYVDHGDDSLAWFQHLEASLRNVPSGHDSDPSLSMVLNCCRSHGNKRMILLSGVAGTGKTRMALAAGQVLANNMQSRYFEMQFHESYSYDDFIEGLVPTPDGGFVLRKKVFRLANDLAHGIEDDGAVVLVIEEFSRANLANVLGELLTYFEHRGRVFRYPLSGDTDYVDPKLIIIGTMNPLDRSVVEMDDALIRRTRRIEFGFDLAALETILTGNGVEAHVVQHLVSQLSSVCNALPFGHGVFVDVHCEADLHSLWKEQLREFLQKPSGQRHPALEPFENAFPWIAPSYRHQAIGSP